MSTGPRLVVKLGGSLAQHESLRHWLRALAAIESVACVIVPGGGPFADAVRAAQRRWVLSEGLAHSMALTAMEQFGHMLCGLQPGLTACASRARIEQAWGTSDVTSIGTS